MQNHFHALIFIDSDSNRVGATGPVAPTLSPNSLGSIVGQFKSVATKKIRKEGCLNFKWQRNYYDRIIRNNRELNMIRKYIFENPLNWEIDKNNPENLNIRFERMK
jgi:REP element-mobilizing transposase RayT